MEARHIEGYKYRIQVTLFFDNIGGNVNSKDTLIQIAAYRKDNNRLIDFFNLTLTTDKLVPYSDPKCAVGTNISINEMVLADTLELSLPEYRTEGGFYLVWERCCRNATVINIEKPSETGMVFYLEMPSITASGFNSTPSFNPIAGDYACANRFFDLNFSATDPDGDSLAYTLVTPWAGNSTAQNPVSFPSQYPYTEVVWKQSFGAENSINGKIPLQIDAETGLLGLNASLTGLYSFAVRCEEYRNNVKIGEIRKEFQLPVANCPIKQVPEIFWGSVPGVAFTNADTVALYIGQGFCRPFYAVDTVQATDMGFYINYPRRQNPQSATIKPPINYTVSPETDTLQSTFCVNGFLPGSMQPYRFDVIVRDDACPTPNRDTVSVYVLVTDTLKKPDIRPSTPLPEDWTVKPNEPVEIEIVIDTSNSGYVGCNGNILVSVPGQALSQGAQVSVEDNKVTIRWLPNCQTTTDSVFNFRIIYEDNECITPFSDTTIVKVKVEDAKPEENKPLPNFISPNGDSYNEYFHVKELLLNSCRGSFEEIKIYNRWGVEIYQTRDYNFEWHATGLPDGMYFYHIRYINQNLNGYIVVAR